MTRRIASALLTCTVLASGAGAACSDRGGASSTGSAQPATPVIRPVVLPDLGRVPAALATQLRERHAAVDRMRDNTPGLAQAYGELGMALMAAEAHREAEAALANAEALA